MAEHEDGNILHLVKSYNRYTCQRKEVPVSEIHYFLCYNADIFQLRHQQTNTGQYILYHSQQTFSN